MCLESITKAETYIQAGSDVEKSLWHDMNNTLNDIFQHPNTKNPNFRLYVLGYAHLFNLDSDSAWCDASTFSVNTTEWRLGTEPKLTNALRTKINEVTSEMNARLLAIVESRKDKPVVFISVTDGFAGHRFCEKGSGWWYDRFGSNVWLWNVTPWDLIGTSTTTDSDNQAAIDYDFTSAWGPNAIDPSARSHYNWADLLDMDIGNAAQQPFVSWSAGALLRPLHPKEDGHNAIKEIVWNRVIEDFPGTAKANS